MSSAYGAACMTADLELTKDGKTLLFIHLWLLPYIKSNREKDYSTTTKLFGKGSWRKVTAPQPNCLEKVHQIVV